MTEQHKISFCITCKGRLDHLQETLPRNLENNKDYPKAEFVILDYDSRDGLGDWIKQNYKAEVESGRILYAHYVPAPYFKMAHAKNMAHRLATGDVVCNLDADNITAPGYAAWLNEQFIVQPDAIIRPSGNSMLRKLSGAPRTPSGSRGRIAISPENFFALHGYDEKYEGHGNEDNDFMRRALAMHLKRVPVPDHMVGEAIEHPNERRVEQMAPQQQENYYSRIKTTGVGSVIPMKKLHKLADRLNAVGRKANEDGRFGAIEPGATLRDISGSDIVLEPYPHVPEKQRPGMRVRR